MIRKTGQGYVVQSESGKRLSKPFRRKEDAERRLRQIEYFKRKGERR